MPYVISEHCAGTCDTACVDVCPVDCIHGPLPLDELRATSPETRTSRHPALQLYIDPSECICCAACVGVCPVGAIFEEDDVPTESLGAIAANAGFFTSKRDV